LRKTLLNLRLLALLLPALAFAPSRKPTAIISFAAGDVCITPLGRASLMPIDAARSLNPRVASPCLHASDVDMALAQARLKDVAGVDTRIRPMR